MLEAVCRNERSEKIYNAESLSRSNASWIGTKSWEDCLGIVSNGWEDGRKQVDRYTKQYSAVWSKFFPQQDYGVETQKSEVGSIIVVEDYLTGQPDCMLDFHPDYKKQDKASGQKLQRIIVNCAVSSYMNIETIYQQGSLVAALINSMELSGFNVELVVVWNLEDSSWGRHGSSQLCYALTVKSFQQHIDTDRLAFSIAHPSMFRRFIFAAMEQEPDEWATRFCNNSYGVPHDLLEEDIAKFGVTYGGELKHGNMYFKILRNNYTEKELIEQCTAVVKAHFTEISFNDKEDDSFWDKSSAPPQN